MLESSMEYILIRSLPESILLVLAGAMLLDLDIGIKNGCKLGLIMSAIVGLIRFLPITFGVHTILSIVILGIILIIISRGKLIQSIIATLTIFISLVFSESIYLILFKRIFKTNVVFLLNNTNFSMALLSLPSLIIFLGLVFSINKLRKKCLNLRGN